MSLEAHIYFVPASHLHHISSGTWMQLGDCIVHVRPCGPDSDLYAVILGCSKATPSSERRQALRALAREEASPTLHPMVMRMLQNVELPSEGPAPLLSLSQLMRQNPKDWYKLYEGKVKRIKNRSLIRDLNAVSVRAYDSKDVTVERLLDRESSMGAPTLPSLAHLPPETCRLVPSAHFTLVEQYPQQKRLRARWVSVSLILKSS